METNKKRPTWTRGADFARMVVAVCWMIGIYAIVAAADASGSPARAGASAIALTAAAAVAFWGIHRFSKLSDP
ncbi:MAG: hypothetical protein WEG36_05820 [Gemmatimonadota bacterium]